MNADFMPILIGAAVLTLISRVAGYALLSRLRTIPPRLSVALDAVPVAVLTTLFAPTVFAGGWREALAMVAALVLGLRIGATGTVVLATALLAFLRAV